MNLRQWMQIKTPGDAKLWREAAHDQFRFFDRLTSLVTADLPCDTEAALAARDDVAQVIGTHRSKSIELPVVQWARPDLGLTLTMRNNFHDYKLSVRSELPINDPAFPALFHTTPPPDPEYTGDPLSSVYFEGFPPTLVYGYQSADHRRWSAEIYGEHAAYMVVFLCMRAVGAVRDLSWPQRANPSGKANR